MGCCGSQDSETRGRLAEVDKTLKGAGSPASGSTDGLEDMAKCAKELRSVMDKIVSEGAKDREGIQRIETLSDSIVGNLTARITIDALQKGAATFQPLEEKIVEIARELDKVRATKATTIIEQHIATERGRIEMTLEKRAAPPLQQMQATMEKITLGDTKQLVPGCKAVLDLAEQTHGIAPENKKVTDQILKHIVQLSIHILKVESVWIVDLKSCELIKKIADRLDTLAQNLVKVMGANWDPPMAPQVDDVIKTTAEKACTELLAAGSKELEAENAGGAYDALEVLLNWWPVLKDTSSHNLEIVGMFSKVQTYADQAYLKATTSSDKDSMTGIKEFAGKFDALRSKFEGLPPPAEGMKLGDKLKVGEAKGNVIKHLSVLDAEVKTMDDDKSMNLSLAVVVQAMEALAAVWPTVLETGADAELSEKVGTSFKNIEGWCEGTAAKLPPDRVGSLLKFAEEYDSRRLKIQPDSPNLRPRIALNAAEKYLKATEAEAAKLEGMKPNVLFDSLKLTVDALPREADELPDGAMDKLRTRLSAAFTSVDARIMKTFQETLVSGDGSNERKEEMLIKFATKLDELRAESRITDEEGAASLVERLQGRRTTMADENMTIIEDQLDILVDRPDFDAVLQALCLLEQSWSEELTEDKKLTGRFTEVCSSLDQRLSEACSKSALAGDVGRADELLELAGELDLAANGIRSKSGDAEEGVNLRSSACKLAVDAHLKIADAALKQGKLEALTKELAILDKLCSPRVGLSPCPDEACESVLTFVSGLKVPLQNLSAKSAENMEAAMKAAIAGDQAANVARKDREASDKDGVVAALKIIQGVLKKLEEARVETAKTSGMNPRVVVEILKELEPLWPSACSQEGCQKSLLEVLDKLHAKFEDAGKKAISDAKKLEALLAFSKDADKAQEALLNQSEGISSERNYTVLSRVCADDCLAKMEAELSKETGMNPAKLLKGLKEMVPYWEAFGKPSAMDPAFDTVAAIKDRWTGVRTKIGSRMAESMADAVSSSNESKKQALLKFAGEFDSECKGLGEEVSSLEEELRVKTESSSDAKIPTDSNKM